MAATATAAGGGTLSALTLIVVVTAPAGLATGDFNEDGIPDVAVSASTNDVTVALNDGAGGVLGPHGLEPLHQGAAHLLGLQPQLLGLAGAQDPVVERAQARRVGVLPGWQGLC